MPPTGRALASLLLVLALVGCGAAPTATLPPTATVAPTPVPTAAAPAPTATGLPTATPTATSTIPPPTATVTPTAAPTPETLFRLVGDGPIVRHGATWDTQFLDPGAIVYHQGQFHMFYNGITAFPRPVGVGYATSPDGIAWTRQGDQPVLALAPVNQAGNYDGPNLFATSALVLDDGTWVLYFYNLLGGNFTGRQSVGRATAPAPTGPWTIDPAPVLEPGPAGAWDALQVTSPNVLRTEQGYVMYYEGAAAGTAAMIGRATSPDGLRWTKHDDPGTSEPLYAASDPVLRPGPAGAWDGQRILDPNVIRTSRGWAMIYLATGGVGAKFAQGAFELGYATSPDGVTWTRSPSNPVISSKNHPTWRGIYLVTLVARENRHYLYFDVAIGGTEIYGATHDGELP